MTIDLNRPLRCKDGREAKYLGELPDGRHAFTWQSKAFEGKWLVGSGDEADPFIENVPPPLPKLRGYCPVWNGRAMEQCHTVEGVRNSTYGEWAIDLSTLTAANFVQVRP